MTDTQRAEQEFYSRYSWCLNAALSVEELLQRLQEELDHYEILTGWQREESKANLYLFVCAIACTADDYLALRWIDLKPVSTRAPRLRRILSPAQYTADAVQAVLSISDMAVSRWRRRWTACLEDVCALLLAGSDTEPARFSQLRRTAAEMMNTALPEGLRKRRMRLPEAFRGQDMSHHDVVRLIQSFCTSESANEPILMLGLRTAGAYFVPLMAEYLKTQGFTDVTWVSIRPKNGISRSEKRQLRAAGRANKRVLVVDDYPSTGHTFRLTLGLLREHGIRDDRIAVLAPTHAAQRNWAKLANLCDPIRVFTIQPDDLYKVDVLAPHAIEALCAEYYGSSGFSARVVHDDQLDVVNKRLAEHLKDGHHAREKRVVSVELRKDDGSVETKKLFFKSAGWGWLGYHAYIAGTRLEGFVPKVIGLRNGLLVSEWIDEKQPEVAVVPVQRIASYVAARARRLTLEGDCRLESSTYRWTGYDHMLSVLRQAYGPYINRLKVPALRKELQKYVSSVAALVDGRMRSEEWLYNGSTFYKVDFEHHNFGGGEPDIVDPAYDLAAAMFEFRMTTETQKELLRCYIQESGDATVGDRILFHKLFYGSVAEDNAKQALLRGKDPCKNNEAWLYARNFLIYAMTEFCAGFAQLSTPSQWTPSLFFMDLDGVFDYEVLGFPHATNCSLQSISLLQSHGFSIVPNTGRGVQHVRQYCTAYGFPGGIAEYGSVFFDAVNQGEIPLIDPVAAAQITACREAIKALPGVFVDPAYEYSIRAYRYTNQGMAGLAAEELKGILGSPEFSRLTYIWTRNSSYIVQKRVNKGSALQFVRRLVGSRDIPVTAIGDSVFDIPMLRAAEYAYAPSNCAPLLRKLEKEGKCRIVRQRLQSGLLAAVQHRLRCGDIRGDSDTHHSSPIFDKPRGLMETLLYAADRRLVPQIVLALIWWSM